ncbi:MAG: DNA-processing protein DprA [Clostridiales bacterium]|nr:DNA-processing protein DprA [Candidatus Crickella merdequi]
MDIKIIDIDSELYPESLRNISNKPRKLYCAGDISLLNEESIAVVGSRKYTLYGKQVAALVGRTLGQADVPVVSGMAAGIDTFAHEGLLESGGRPVAVLGTGLERPYPKKNKALYQRIIEEGLVISEYEPDFPGRPETFPARNRIIAGLSSAIVVIEANFKSGALITAQFGMEQGKTIYAVPGNINSQFSLGTNLLLRDGATPLVVIDDLLRDLGKDITRADTISMDMGPDEKAVFDTVVKNNGISVNEICHNLNKKAQEVNAILTILEIKGAITSYGGRIHLAK